MGQYYHHISPPCRHVGQDCFKQLLKSLFKSLCKRGTRIYTDVRAHVSALSFFLPFQQKSTETDMFYSAIQPNSMEEWWVHISRGSHGLNPTVAHDWVSECLEKHQVCSSIGAVCMCGDLLPILNGFGPTYIQQQHFIFKHLFTVWFSHWCNFYWKARGKGRCRVDDVIVV